ncbi:MAG TPA: hypothetical protein VMW27_09960 [Thermoanaerobaculia bacterium]|nr:hypothetical protein [Thermoanaerobaculia bacterium]
MAEAIADTGPILHLHEIGQLSILTSLGPVALPDLVLEELAHRGIDISDFQSAGVEVRSEILDSAQLESILQGTDLPQIQPADIRVFALAKAGEFAQLVLTDDLALRRLLENHGAEVVGSVGVLLRAYKDGRIVRATLDRSVDALLRQSSLHLSRAFRVYLRSLLENLP